MNLTPYYSERRFALLLLKTLLPGQNHSPVTHDEDVLNVVLG